MLKWYSKYCIAAFIIGAVLGFLIGEWLIVHEYILVPGFIESKPLTT